MFTRVFLSIALAANAASPAFARNLAMPKLSPSVSPAAGPAPLANAPTIGAGNALTLAAPTLGTSLPTLAPGVLPAAETPTASVAAKAAPSAVTAAAAPAASLAAPAKTASADAPAAYKGASVRSETVRRTVETVLPAGKGAAVAGRSAKIAAPSLDLLFDRARRSDALNGADTSKDAVDADVDARVKEDAASDLIMEPRNEDDHLDLWFGKTVRPRLFNSHTSAAIRPINGAGSKRYWGRYQRRIPIRVIAGGQVQFITRIVRSSTKKIADLTLEDYKAYYGPRIAAKRSGENEKAALARLERKLLAEIKWKAERKSNAPKVISDQLKVRVLHFLPYNQARDLPENGIEKTPQIRERKNLEVPAALEDLQRMLPRLVLYDLRLYGDRIPFDVLEDMGKLQKAGMTFVFLSDKTQDEVEKMIRRDTPPHQQNDITRWKLLSLSNDGNTLYGYSGSFEELKASSEFRVDHQDILSRAGAATAEGVVVSNRPYKLALRPKRGFAIADLKLALEKQLQRFGMPKGAYAVTEGEFEGKEVVQVRPTTLASSMDWLIKQLQAEEGLYLNQQHIMTVTDDAALKAALPGAFHAGDRMPKATEKADWIETSLAAMLGSYRINKVGDLAASASSMKSFKYQQLYGGGGGFEYRIYMLMGHVGHTAFDWAIMKYNEDGALPPFEDLIAKAREIWDKEDIGVTTNMLERPRESTLGYRDAMEARMFTMYEDIKRNLKLYPIAVGTEIPNLMVVDRYNKEGEWTHRDIFRGLMDLVLAKKVPGGIEAFVTDFKTGQTPALQHMVKDLQVLLYDYFARRQWPTMSIPFSLDHKLEKVVSRIVAFIFPTGMQGKTINEFDRLTFEKTVNLLMLKMRKHKGNLTEEMMEKERKKAEREARKELREANKKAKEAKKRK
jgi:hypothetical protein